MLTDARHALRRLWREPTVALTATLTLALGVATTTTVFSVVDAELWKPLPFPHARELVKISARVGGRITPISGAELLDWRAGVPAVVEMAGDGLVSRQTLQLDTAQSVLVSHVTANYFDVLGRRLLAGRTFGQDDGRGSRTVVLTDRSWRRLFESTPATIGRTVPLDGQQVTIIGVVQANDSMGPDADLFLAMNEGSPEFADRSQTLLYGAIGRLQSGLDLRVAQAQIEAAAARESSAGPGPRTIHVEDLSEFYRSSNGRPLYFLLGASLVVLLLSAVNVASLVLARAFSRMREFALRGALGGGQLALARQLLAEAAWLALPAGALGAFLAQWGVGAIAVQLPDDVLLRGTEIPVDYRVWLFAFAISSATALVFALVPLVATRRLDLVAALGAGARTGRTAAAGRARFVLLTSQFALTMVLLCGAAIFLKSFVALNDIPLGFDPSDRLVMRTPLGGPRYASDAAIHEYADRVLAVARATPGVRDAGLGSSSPLGSGPMVTFAFPDRPRPAPGREPRAIIRAATPAFFRSLGISILRGRDFTDADSNGAPRVAIVNAHLADQIAGDANPIGRTIELLPGARTAWTRRPGVLEIIGVVANVKEVGLNEVLFSGIYVPVTQMTPPGFELIARTSVPSVSVADTLRQRLAAIDTAVPMSRVSTFDERIDRALRPGRFNLMLISAFAAAGVLLACVGIYGAVAYAIQARTRELGICLALGAHPARLVRSALWQAARVGIAGGVLGLLATLALARAMGDALYLVPGSHNGLLYGVSTTDPMMLGAAFAGITIVAVFAAMAPARRISRLDPVRALRSE